MMNLLEKISGKSVNFLIGAGASAGLYPTLYLHDEYSLEDVLSHKDLTENSREFLLILYFIHWIYPMYEETKDTEALGGSNSSKSDKKIKEAKENYQKFVRNLVNFMIREPKSSPNRINIFTTNYDLMFEQAFDQVVQEFPLVFFNDGSSGFIDKTISNDNYYIKASHVGYKDYYTREIPNINLFKPHGSVSWRLEGDEKESDEKEVLKTKIKVDYNLKKIKKEFDQILEKYLNEIISEIEEDNAWKALEKPESNTLELKEYVDEVNRWGEKWSEIPLDTKDNLKHWLRTNVPIINPHKWKFHETVMDEHYYQQLRSLSYELEQENSVLIVFGFSFADEHIRNIIKRSLYNPSLQVYIITYNQKAYMTIKDYFKGYKNIKYLPSKEVLFDTSGDFTYLNSLLSVEKLSDKND